MSTAIATSQQQTAIATVNDKTVLPMQALRALVSSKIDIIKDALPEKMKGAAPRFAISLITACQATPDLSDCTALSLFGGIVKAANLGLELGGECWLIPRKQKDVAPRGQTPGPDYLVANFQIGWKGIVTLLYRNPRVLRVAADMVREGDDFQLINGTESRIVHSYGKSRGPVTDYYAVIKLRGGESINCVMSKAEVDDHRKQFASNTSKAWRENFDAMALKTVIIKAGKTSPRAIELPDGAESEEVAVVGVDLLPANAMQPRPEEKDAGVEGEVVSEGTKKIEDVSCEELDAVAKLVAEREKEEFGNVEFEIADLWGKQAFAELTQEQRVKAHASLTKRLK